MPIHLLTLHAYRSWTEDNPRGYVQRGRVGIQPPRPGLARYRARIASQAPVRFWGEQMRLALDTSREVCMALGHDPLAASCTATHLHILVAIMLATDALRSEPVSTGPSTGPSTGRKPGANRSANKRHHAPSTALTGGARPGDARPDGTRSGGMDGEAGQTVDALCARIKSIVGLRLSRQRGTTGNRWFSRGKDATAVRSRKHLEYLLELYLPRHELAEGGLFVRWCNSID